MGTLWADVTFSWFAWDHAAWATRFSRIFGRKSIVVVGGFDVVKMPEISYGNLLIPRSAARTLYAIRHADQVIAVSKSLKADAERLSGRQDIGVVYHGFEVERFTPAGSKEPVALTVGAVSQSNMKRKGIETFMKAASHAPEIEFRIVGAINPALIREIKESAPGNLVLTGKVDFDTLLKEMQKASVYVQVSGHEGFGCSLAEAMLCADVPVVTKAGAIPEVVGDCGYYVPYDDPGSTAEAVRKALGDSDKGRLARERIVKEFPLSKREEGLVQLISDVIQ